jgi:acetolactate synthase-1/3 small subunit
MSQKSIVAFLVENKPGVLFNVANLFRRRGFNIHTISTGTLLDGDVTRMTIIVEQLDKMVDVIVVRRLEPVRTVLRELLLVKLSVADPMAREEALRVINEYHGLIHDIGPESLIAEVTGEPERIDQFLEQVKSIGIEEMSRTGATALEKGRLKLELDEKW